MTNKKKEIYSNYKSLKEKIDKNAIKNKSIREGFKKFGKVVNFGLRILATVLTGDLSLKPK